MASENNYRKMLMYFGIISTVFGFILVYKVFSATRDVNFMFLQALFIVTFLGLLLMLAHSNQTVRDELAMLLKEHNEETEVLRRINQENLSELKVLKKKG